MPWKSTNALRSRGARHVAPGLLAAVAGATVFGVVPLAAAAPARPVTTAALRQTLAPYVVEWSRLAAQGGNATADLGPAAANAQVSARVYLAGRDPGGLAAYAAAVSRPGSDLFHHYLTPAQVRARFGPDASQVSAVRPWLSASGLRITAVTGHYIAVSGTAAGAQRAFGAGWHSYTVDGRTQQAPAPAARLSAPALVAPAVLTVAPVETGLPGYPAVASPAARAAGRAVLAARAADPAALGTAGPRLKAAPAANPGCSSYFGQDLATSLPEAYGRVVPYFVCGYTPGQVRSAYGVPGSLTGAGVTVAVVHPWREPTAAQDLATFGARHGEPLRPGQFTQVLPAGLDASCAGTTQGPFQMTNEETADVELVHATAPAAKIVYVGAKCDDGEGTVQDLDALTTIVGNRLATIVSNSWAAVGSDATLSPGLVGAYEQVFEQGGAEGIGFYFSAGDGGEYSGGPASAGIALIYPQSDPWVTSVGGTSLAIGPAGSYQWEAGWATGSRCQPRTARAGQACPAPSSRARGAGQAPCSASPRTSAASYPPRSARPAATRPCASCPTSPLTPTWLRGS